MINLPNYYRTEQTRYLKALIHLKEGERSCKKVLFPGKMEYCPVQGRDRPGETPSEFRRVNLLMDANPESWKIESAGVSRSPISGQEDGGNRIHAVVRGEIEGIPFKIPTQLFNVDIDGTHFDVTSLIDQKVDPVIRLLDMNPGSIKYYGVVFAPYSFERKPKPFTEELIDFKTPGIASIGLAVPKYRCKAEELVRTFGKSTVHLTKGLKVESVSVPDYMETTGTLAVQAAYEAMRVLPKKMRETVGAIYIGTESPDHKVKGQGTVIQEMLGVGRKAAHDSSITLDCPTTTSEFACVPTWMHLRDAYANILAGVYDTAILVGSDIASGAPGHPLDLDTGAMGGAIVVSRYNHILTALSNENYTPAGAVSISTSDESDFQNDHKYPDRLIGAYSLKPFQKLQSDAIQRTLQKLDLEPSDFSAIAPHTPNGNSPYRLMRALGFDHGPLAYTLEMVKHLGNTYTAAVIGNLRRAVELMQPGDLVLISGYGSTAGAVAAGFEATDLLPRFLETVVPTDSLIKGSEVVSPVTYAQRLFRKDMVIKN